MEEPQRVNLTTESQGAVTPPAADEAYHPQPPRPFVSRGGAGKRAGQRDEYYSRNRETILWERHAKNMKARERRGGPTVEEKRRSHERRSAAAKRREKEMSPETKAAKLRNLDAGRAVQLEQYRAERKEWEAITLRVNGASLIEIADKLGFGKSRKRVRTAIRSVDLPKGKRYLCDRGRPFTRGSGIELYNKTLGQGRADFARLISTPDHPVREQRIVIWFTNRQKHLAPVEAQACMGLRDRIAKTLLGQDGGRGRDSYDRREVLAALFPRYREEYKTLGRTLRAIGAFLEDNSEAKESDITGLVIRQAQDEVSGKLDTTCFRELIRWLAERKPGGKEAPLPELMPVILKHRSAIVGTNNPHRVAVEILADTMGVPPKILLDAIEEQIAPASPEKMRYILRSFPQFAPTAKPADKRKKRGAAKDTPQRLHFMAAWDFLKLGTYGLAKKLYPGESQDNAEASTRSLRKYHANKQLQELMGQMDEQKAKAIVEAGL